jgi:predicted permease
VPLGFDGIAANYVAVDGYVPARAQDMRLPRSLIAPGFFELMRIRMLEGRDITEHEARHGAPVIIVSETFARRFFSGGAAIGRRVRVDDKAFTVIGVVSDCKYQTITETPRPFYYVPFEQLFGTGHNTAFYIRTAGDPAKMAAMFRREVAALDPGVAFHAIPLAEQTSVSLYPRKVAASLLTLLAALSLLLAAVGLYSVVSYTVSQRTQEFGIRMALGARPSDVLRMVMGNSMRLVGAGILAGVALTLAASRIVATMLVDVSPADPGSFAGAAAFLIVVALLASYLPARRATKVEPMTALRSQ